MKMSLVGWITESVIVVLVVAACAGVQQKPMVLEPGEKALVMKVESFKFEPSNIKAHKGDNITLQLENLAGVEHNLTIKAPGGTTVASVDIPAKGKFSIKVNLEETGIYPFYCDKTFHSTLGMKGQIEVSAP